MNRRHQSLQELRRFRGTPMEFWNALLAGVMVYSGGGGGVLMRCPRGGQDWGVVSELGGGIGPFDEVWRSLAGRAMKEGVVVEEGRMAAMFASEGVPVAVGLTALEEGWDDTVEGLEAYSDLPEWYLRHQSTDTGERKAARLATVLDLGLGFTVGTKFSESAIRLCQEIASRFGADRVSLGWLRGRAVRLEAMSHTEKIDPRSEVVLALEAAMEEAWDQDDEVLFPAPEGASQIARQHEAYAQRISSGAHLLSVPLRDAQHQPVGILTLERKEPAMEIDEVEVLRLAGDFLGPTLTDASERSRWWGARWTRGLGRGLGKLFGLENIGWKLLGLFLLGLGLFLALFQMEHRIKAPFVVKSTATAQVSAPFDGFLREVHCRVGDQVEAEEELVSLDIRDLLLEESEIIAEQQRFQGEARQAENSGDSAQMQIARFQGQQAQSRLDIVRLRMKQATIRAPFAGIVVEGDLQERISAPVQRGELLVRLVKVEGLYAELRIDERDISFLRPAASCELAFTSLPAQRFEAALEPLDPVAEVTDQGTVFQLRCRFEGEAADWWRPGMTGVCKIDAGSRSLWWILTHRTVDFLRSKLWL